MGIKVETQKAKIKKEASENIKINPMTQKRCLLIQRQAQEQAQAILQQAQGRIQEILSSHVDGKGIKGKFTWKPDFSEFILPAEE